MGGTIIVKGWYGHKNLGDDLLFIVLTKILTNACDAKIVLWCRKRSYLSRMTAGLHFLEPWTQLHRPVILLWGGGTQFISFPGSDRVWYLPENLLSLLHSPKRLARSPVTVYRLFMEYGRMLRSRSACWRGGIGIGVGPFIKENRNTEAMVAELQSMDWIAVRDEESLAVCLEYGISKNKIILGADLSFLHPCIGTKLPKREKIVIIPRVSPVDQNWGTWEDAIYKAFQTISPDCLEIISLCERDHDVARCLGDRLKTNVVIWDPDIMSLETMIQRIATARLVVSARYHGALISGASGVPTIVMNLEQKLQSLARQLPNVILCNSTEELVGTISKWVQINGDNITVNSEVNKLKAAALHSVCTLLDEFVKVGIRIYKTRVSNLMKTITLG
ncbi:MAG: polysaccharide pyruvyl transferase family protein [Candidatus Methanomethylicaceae archaeon]